jgi:type IV secretion system protein VirD4
MPRNPLNPDHSGALDARVSKPIFGRHGQYIDAIGSAEATWAGGARWLTPRELEGMPALSRPNPGQAGFSDLAGEVYLSEDVPNERSQAFLNGPGLLLTFGAPGGGKSSQITTQLLRPRPDSLIVLDVKGELYERCAPYLRKHMTVEQHGLFFSEPGAGFNPIKAIPNVPPGASYLSEAAIRAQTECVNLAEDLIEQTLDQPFWVNAERAVCAALLFHVKTAPLAPDAQTRSAQPHRVRTRTMAEVRRLLSLDGEPRKKLIAEDMAHSPMPFVQEGALSWMALAAAKDTYAAVHSDLLKQLSVWAHPVVEANSRECGYEFASLRETPTAVFLRVPPAQMKLCKPWMRAYFGTAMRHLMHATAGCGVTIYLDEAAQLGTMESFDAVIGAIRGYRLRLNCYYQSIGQLRAAYPTTWETWLSTAFSKVFFAVNDVDTAELVSRSIGDTTVAVPSFQVSEGDTRSGSVTTTDTTATADVTGEQVGDHESETENTPPEFRDGPNLESSGTAKSKGTNRVRVASKSISRQSGNSHMTGWASNLAGATTWTYTRRRLLDPTEVMTLPDGLQIVLTPRGPILAHMARFFENPSLLQRASAVGQVLPSPSYAVPGRKADSE